MGIWKEHFHPNVLLQWEVVGWIIGTLLAVGGIVLIFDQYLIANLCFIAVAAFVCAKVVHSAVIWKGAMLGSVVFAFVLCGVVGAGITATVRGINAYRDRKAKLADGRPTDSEGVKASAGDHHSSPSLATASAPASPGPKTLPGSDSQALADPISSLSQLGWAVKRDSGLLTFEATNKPLPSMTASRDYLARLREPFRLQFQSVPSLDGLERLWGIGECKEILLSASDLSSISQLAGFKSLQKLEIAQIPLNTRENIDSGPLAGLVNLTSLVLNSSRVSDLTFVTRMPRLQRLIMESTLTRDIAPVRSLQNLKVLDVRESPVADISPVSANMQLEELVIDMKQVSGLEELSSLRRLRKLTVIGQIPVDLSPIGRLSGLQSLFVWGSPYLNLSFLSKLPNLTDLQISGFGAPIGPRSRVTGSESICAGGKLITLTLGALEMPSLPFAAQCRSLVELNLREIPLTSLNDLPTMQGIRKVSLVDVPVVEISPLLSLPNLEHVFLVRVPARADVIAALERSGVKVDNP
jgi:hypothetical protein